MSPHLIKTARVLGHIGFVTMLALGAAWAATAFWVQLGGAVVWAAWAALAIAVLAALATRFRSPGRAWVVLGVAAVAVGM